MRRQDDAMDHGDATPNDQPSQTQPDAAGNEDVTAYVAFQEGTRLLDMGNAHAAAVALERARSLEPAKGSIRETLARAYYRAGRFDAAEGEFLAALDLDPVNDYAHFGVGMCRLRSGDRVTARRHLRLANAMRPDNVDYQAALAQTGDDPGSDAHP
jgi:Flp pilus assembly protein TadD